MTEHAFLRKVRIAIIMAIFVISCGERSWAGITWNVTYNDVVNTTGIGFDDATFGASRRATFESVFSYINTVVNHAGTVDLRVKNSLNDGASPTLASAGAFVFDSPNRFDNGFVFEHATTGTDPTASEVDGTAEFNFGHTWNSELDAPTGSEFDLFSVSLHEITHAMGFSSYLKSDGTSGISNADPGVYSVYDSFLERGDGTALFAINGDYTGTAADLISEDVFFDGTNARAANGGNAVPVYAPNPFNGGSSIAHLDDGVSSVMNFSIAAGVSKRTYSAIDTAVLADIGWTLTAVPEPSLLGMLLVIGIGSTARRRRNRGVLT